MERFLLVCLGGAFGTGARYAVSLQVAKTFGTAFPFGTLVVNVLGSFLLGLLLSVGLDTDWLSPNLRLALTTGAMGGFTTYSTFSYETLRLLQDGAHGRAALNVAVTVVVCLVASYAGLMTARAVVGAAA